MRNLWRTLITAGIVVCQIGRVALAEGPERLELATMQSAGSATAVLQVELSDIDQDHPIYGVTMNLEWDPGSCWQIAAPEDAAPGPGFDNMQPAISPGSISFTATRTDAIEIGQVVATFTFTAEIGSEDCCLEQVCLAPGAFPTTTSLIGPGYPPGQPPYRSVPILGPCVGLRVLGDVDVDGNVDLEDADRFIGCMDGPASAPTDPCCTVFDYVADEMIDLRDLAEFMNDVTDAVSVSASD